MFPRPDSAGVELLPTIRNQLHDQIAQFVEQHSVIRAAVNQGVHRHARFWRIGRALHDADATMCLDRRKAVRTVSISAAQHDTDDASSEDRGRTLEKQIGRWPHATHFRSVIDVEQPRRSHDQMAIERRQIDMSCRGRLTRRGREHRQRRVPRDVPKLPIASGKRDDDACLDLMRQGPDETTSGLHAACTTSDDDDGHELHLDNGILQRPLE